MLTNDGQQNNKIMESESGNAAGHKNENIIFNENEQLLLNYFK